MFSFLGQRNRRNQYRPFHRGGILQKCRRNSYDGCEYFNRPPVKYAVDGAKTTPCRALPARWSREKRSFDLSGVVVTHCEVVDKKYHRKVRALIAAQQDKLGDACEDIWHVPTSDVHRVQFFRTSGRAVPELLIAVQRVQEPTSALVLASSLRPGPPLPSPP